MIRWAVIAALALAAPVAAAPVAVPTVAPALRLVEGSGGVPLLVAEWGNRAGPEILLIHGYAMSWLSWRRQLDPGLARRFHLVAFDLRGHGGSGKPWRPADYADSGIWAADVAAVMHATGLRRPVLVGWSYGGFVALDHLRAGGTAAGLVLVGSLAGLVSREELGAPADAFGDAAAIAAQNALDARANVTGERRFVAALTAAPAAPEDAAIALRETLALPAYARAALMARSFDNRDLLAWVTLPIRIIVGGLDRATPWGPARAVAARLPAATLSLYPRAGHAPFLEEAPRFNRELAAFVETVWR